MALDTFMSKCFSTARVMLILFWLLAGATAWAGQYRLLVGQPNRVPVGIEVRNAETLCNVEIRINGGPPIQQRVSAPDFMAWLVLDVTPSSIDWKKNILLGYVEPDQYGALKTRQEVEAERLKRINASTMFMPQQLVPSEDKQSVVVRGRLRTLVNGFETANDLKAYLIEFSFNGARMHLKTFKEVPNAS